MKIIIKVNDGDDDTVTLRALGGVTVKGFIMAQSLDDNTVYEINDRILISPTTPNPHTTLVEKNIVLEKPGHSGSERGNMKKIKTVIDKCEDCPFFKRTTDRKIEIQRFTCTRIGKPSQLGSSIPDWCPLEDYLDTTAEARMLVKDVNDVERELKKLKANEERCRAELKDIEARESGDIVCYYVRKEKAKNAPQNDSSDSSTRESPSQNDN